MLENWLHLASQFSLRRSGHVYGVSLDRILLPKEGFSTACRNIRWSEAASLLEVRKPGATGRVFILTMALAGLALTNSPTQARSRDLDQPSRLYLH